MICFLLRLMATADSQIHIVMASNHVLCVLCAAAATGMLRDPHHTPANAAAEGALSALLTQSLAARLVEPDPRPLLVCLNSSMETAQVIWNSGMREELSKVGRNRYNSMCCTSSCSCCSCTLHGQVACEPLMMPFVV
jgi:hypothetical protein